MKPIQEINSIDELADYAYQKLAPDARKLIDDMPEYFVGIVGSGEVECASGVHALTRATLQMLKNKYYIGQEVWICSHPPESLDYYIEKRVIDRISTVREHLVYDFFCDDGTIIFRGDVFETESEAQELCDKLNNNKDGMA